MSRRPNGTAVVDVLDFEFSYAGHHFSSADLDEPAQVRFVRGVPVELIATGGLETLRFGFSAGFERGQFGRLEEAFIHRGRPYFGYLDPDTYVDGAGVVSLGRNVAQTSRVADVASARRGR